MAQKTTGEEYFRLHGRGTAWRPSIYVKMANRTFQEESKWKGSKVEMDFTYFRRKKGQWHLLENENFMLINQWFICISVCLLWILTELEFEAIKLSKSEKILRMTKRIHLFKPTKNLKMNYHWCLKNLFFLILQNLWI